MITSRQNAWFQRVRNAIREHAEEIVIEGPKAVDDAIAGGWKAIAVIHSSDVIPRVARDPGGRVARLTPTQVPRYARDDIAFAPELFAQLSDTKTSQGTLALFERPRTSPAELLARRDRVLVALDGVQDPGNVGTIIRLAAAFDAAGVALLPGCADAFGPKALRAAARARLHMPPAPVTPAE